MKYHNTKLWTVDQIEAHQYRASVQPRTGGEARQALFSDYRKAVAWASAESKRLTA